MLAVTLSKHAIPIGAALPQRGRCHKNAPIDRIKFPKLLEQKKIMGKLLPTENLPCGNLPQTLFDFYAAGAQRFLNFVNQWIIGHELVRRALIFEA